MKAPNFSGAASKQEGENPFSPAEQMPSTEVEVLRPVSVERLDAPVSRRPRVASAAISGQKYGFGLFCFHKVPPNSALVITGLTGIRVVRKRAAFVFPTQMVNAVNLEVTAVPFLEENVRAKDIYSIDLEGIVYFKVKDDTASIRRAAQMLLSRSNDEVAEIVHEILSARLRAVCAGMSINDIQNNLEGVNAKVAEAAQYDFEKMGFQIQVFGVKRIIDKQGFFEGRKARTRARLQLDMLHAYQEYETAKAGVQAELERGWAAPKLEKLRQEQSLTVEETKRDQMGRFVSTQIRTQLMQLEKQIREIQAETRAQCMHILADAKGEAIRKTGGARAEVNAWMKKAYQDLDKGSLSLYLADRMPEILGRMVEPLKNADMNIFDMGGAGGDGRGGAVGRTVQQIFLSAVPVFKYMGLDLQELFASSASPEKAAAALREAWDNMDAESRIEEMGDELAAFFQPK